jgi:hypothetical protein
VSADAKKILIATLWQRTSASGREYLSGFLGKARVVGFRGDPTPDGTPTWDIYLTPGKEQEERGSSPQRSGGEPRTHTSSTRTGVQRWKPKTPAEFRPADPGRPFFDDPVDDIGGGE